MKFQGRYGENRSGLFNFPIAEGGTRREHGADEQEEERAWMRAEAMRPGPEQAHRMCAPRRGVPLGAPHKVSFQLEPKAGLEGSMAPWELHASCMHVERMGA
jgi:hypothetical protein